MRIKTLIWPLLAGLLPLMPVQAQIPAEMPVSTPEERFVVGDIRIEGLQRIPAGSVFAAMPLNVGDEIGTGTIQSIIRGLFRTGNFDDVQVGREGNVLVVVVQERPSISEINIEGNKAIETKALLDGLKNAGLAEGQVFKRATLEGMRMELTRQYVGQGRYDASIQTEVVAQPRNRVAVNIDIDEGSTSAIKHINIVGNEAFSDDDLLDQFELRTSGWFTWITGKDKYAREKLQGDLETLGSFYMDRGYINFDIDSTQVSVTPQRDAVYITLNLIEGKAYQVGKVELSGDIILPEEELRRFILIREGQTFSQSLLTRTEELLTNRLGNEGYNFARVIGIPEENEETGDVDIRFFVDPGKRTYVRRINFRGNNRTVDEVLRREMRQMEAAPASRARIEQSRIRLDRLGHFREAKVDTIEVPGSDDQIDLLYSVEEQPSGSIGASIGFAQDSGLLLGANIQQNNFMGTGKQVGIGVSRSRYLTNVRFSYVNPYFTEDGVSRGFSVFYREANLDEINVASYTTNTLGGSMSFGYPISETQSLGFSVTASRTKIETGFAAVKEIAGSPRPLRGIDTYFVNQRQPDGTYLQIEEELPFDPVANADLLAETEPGFVDRYGDVYKNVTTTLSWNSSTLNRGMLANRGQSHSVAFEVSVPGSDLEYYKLLYNGQIFIPLSQRFTLRLRSELGYGDGFGDTTELPFFEHFFAGGFGSVRGFRSNTLGPRSTQADVYTLRRAVTEIDGDGLPTELSNNFSYVAEDGSLVFEPVRTRRADPFGGNMLVEFGAELLFPLPFLRDQRSVRSGFFLDAGNVFSTNCGATQLNCSNFDLDELRYSAGVGLTWITGFGPLTFSLGRALNSKSGDQTEVFQFSLGRGF